MQEIIDAVALTFERSWAMKASAVESRLRAQEIRARIQARHHGKDAPPLDGV